MQTELLWYIFEKLFEPFFPFSLLFWIHCYFLLDEHLIKNTDFILFCYLIYSLG